MGGRAMAHAERGTPEVAVDTGRLTLEQALQRPGVRIDADSIVLMAEPGKGHALKVAGQLILGVFFPWMNPKSTE